MAGAPERPDADDDGVPADAFAIALASLPEMGSARLRSLLRLGDPELTWTHDVASGRAHRHQRVRQAMGPAAEQLARVWKEAAQGIDPADRWRAHRQAGIGVAMLGNPALPEVLAEDRQPPGVLFWRGDPDVVVGPRVGVVGARDCTRYGLDVAAEIGRQLAAAGIAVVSGLALGIDGAAHAGTIAADAAPPIAVVGSGLDVVYPRQNRRLWEQVAERGVVLSEYPLGASAEPWHFPSRNRLIAALSDVLVVVESHEAGGAMLTVEEAQRRDVPVMAVPGPVTSSASAGTNKLLTEGVLVARDVTDVLIQLGFRQKKPRASAETRPAPTDEDAALLDAFAWQPATFEQLVVRTGRDLPDVSLGLDRLCRDGWVDERGGWYERVAKPGSGEGPGSGSGEG